MIKLNSITDYKFIVILALCNKVYCDPIDIAAEVKNLDGATSSVYIYDIKNKKDILKYNGNAQLIPASLQKLYTAYAVLNKLGPNFKFKTNISYVGKINNHELYGDLYLTFSGDPSLTSPDLKKLLVKSGITRISGDIIIQGQNFDNQLYGPGWMWDELDDCYAAPISSTIIDGNCGSMLIWPGKKENSQANFKIDNIVDQMVTTNIITTKNPNKKCQLKFIRENNQQQYSLNGCIDMSSDIQKIKIASHNNNNFMIKKIEHALGEENIKHDGVIKFSNKITKSTNIASHRSESLTNILRNMIKSSDNLIAESLFKKLGEISFKDKGSWESGHKALLKIMKDKDITLDDSQAIDGSGLSRYNLISTSQVMELLKKIVTDKNYKDDILQTFPTAGIDGTISWISSPALVGQVRGKTGSMTGVYNIAGYFSTITSDYAYVIMINGKGQQNQVFHEAAEKTLNTAILSL